MNTGALNKALDLIRDGGRRDLVLALEAIVEIFDSRLRALELSETNRLGAHITNLWEQGLAESVDTADTDNAAGLVDMTKGKPVRWKSGEGWVEVTKPDIYVRTCPKCEWALVDCTCVDGK